MNRCGNCLAAHRDHRPRMSAPPLCPGGRGVYREGTEEELQAAYRAEFGDGPPVPIATFDLNNPADVERAKAALSIEALNRHFGPGGMKMVSLAAALKGEPEPGNPVEVDPDSPMGVVRFVDVLKRHTGDRA